MARHGTVEKGTLYLAAANMLFLAVAYAIYFALSRMLPSAAEFGNYGVATSMASLISGILLAGMQQTVSKFISERPGIAAAVRGSAIKLQLSISAATFAVFFLASPFIAGLLNDASLTPLLQLSSLLVFSHPMFSVFLGYMNGLKRFARQARLYASYNMLRLVLVIGMVALGFGTLGAIGGFVAASVLGMLVGYSLSLGGPETAEALPMRRLIGFAAPLMLFAVALNAIQYIDIYFLKALLPEALAGELTGYYVAAHLVAGVLPSIAYSLTFVLFPLVSRSTFAKNLEKSRFYISTAMRYCVLAVFPLVFFVFTTPAELLALLYPPEYAAAAPALSTLIVGTGFFSLFYILSSIVSASGRPGKVSVFGLFALAASAVLALVLIPPYGMEGAALSATLAMGLATALAAGYVYFRFRALVNPLSVLRVLIACAVSAWAASYFFAEGLMLIPKFLAFAALYAVLLLLVRELKTADLNIVLNILG